MTNYERQKFVYGLLCKVYFDKAYCGIVLNDGIGLAPEGDRAFITKVFYGVIEKDVYLNYALSALVKQSPQPKVVLVMKIGLYQLYFTDQAPYAVVSSSVDLVKSIGKKEVAGFVNATLKNYKKVRFPDKTDKINYLSVFGGVPVWLAKKLSAEYGFDSALETLTFRLTDKTHIRNNPAVISKEELKNKYGLLDQSEYGFFVGAEQLKKMAPDEYTVQSLSSMKTVKIYLGDLSGGKVLDVCAAPGGKSTQSGLRMGGQGVLVCNEPVWERAKILSQNIERMGIPNALVVSAYPDQLAQRWPEAFDAIQVDAPCSGEGMFRRHPETRAEWSPESPAGCAKRQAEILDRAAEMLRPGGRIVYSTCTMNRTENEDTVDAFLSRHADFSLEAFSLPGADAPDGMLTCYPHRMKGEGHFVALLRKHGDAPCNWQKAPEKDAPSKDALQALRAFCPTANANVMRTGSGKPGRSRDESVTLSCLPDRPVCDGIQVVRCGLQLGTVQKKLFVPDHAWAMSIFPPDVPRVELTREDARRYQAGETLPADGKGWALACCDGIPLGWGKISDGQMKNHYPKGLRRPLR